MSDSRLGAPVELPWWVIPLGLPPLLVALLAVVLAAPLWAHAMAVTASILTIAALVLIALRTSSRNIQSVWVSALYAAWVFVVVTWAVVVATTPACHCA